MGAAFISAATDEGVYDFGGNVDVQFINTFLSVPGPTQLIGIAEPLRIMHAGWVALAYEGGVFTSAPPAILWWKYMEFTSQSFVMARIMAGNVNCDHFHWALQLGVTAQFYIAWA